MRRRPWWRAALDWLAVFAAASSFIWIVLWAASPDSALLTVETALLRTISYSIPITLGMWGIARATRAGSAVPRKMAAAMPYARMGADGKLQAVTTEDDTPTPLGEASENN